MVRPLLVVLLVLAFGVHCQTVYAATLTLQLENNRVELGKYTNLILVIDRAKPSLRSIDLSALHKSFYVDTSADISNQHHTQRWRLRLYPRYAGKLTIAPLMYQNASSASLGLEVTPAVDHKTGHRLLTQASLSTSTAWLNQQVLIRFVLVSQDRHVVLDANSLELPSGKLHLLTQTTLPADKAGYFRHTIGWAYFPQQVGTQLLQLPPVYYKRDGVITHRFYLPGQRLSVKPLPVYVPANFPVGNLMLQVSSPPIMLLTDRLHYVNATLQAKAIAQQQIPQLENYLHGHAGIKLYPATTHLQQSSGEQGLISQMQLQLPIKATHTGLIKLDDIAIQYFEPGSGKLRTLRYQWPTYIFVSPLILVIVGLLLAILLAYGLLRLVKFGRHQWQQYQYWRLARRQLLTATTPQEIKAAIMLIARAQQGLDNITLQRWASFNNIDIEALSQALYQTPTHDLQALKQPYLQLCIQKLRF